MLCDIVQQASTQFGAGIDLAEIKVVAWSELLPAKDGDNPGADHALLHQ